MRSKSSRSEGSKVKKTKEPNTEGNKIMIESYEGIKIAEDLLSLNTISEIRQKIDLIQKDLDLYDQRDKIKDPEDKKNVALDFFKMYLCQAELRPLAAGRDRTDDRPVNSRVLYH